MTEEKLLREIYDLAESKNLLWAGGNKYWRKGKMPFTLRVGTCVVKGSTSAVFINAYQRLDEAAAVQLIAQPLDRFNVINVLVAHVKLNELNYEAGHKLDRIRGGTP